MLVGTTGRTVTYTTSRFYDVTRRARRARHPRVITDDTWPAASSLNEQGFDGRTVKVVRTVKQGGQVLFSDTFVSTYAPKDWIKRIGD